MEMMTLPPQVLREAELKHGRIAMLATLGLLVQEQYVFPFFDKVRSKTTKSRLCSARHHPHPVSRAV
jgi:hypothetical protein